MFCANVIHIAPWRVAEGLFAGAARYLRDDGRLFLYGPFKRDGKHTALSNAVFDTSLRERDPEWGVRDIGDVEKLARARASRLIETVEMPANNLILVFASAIARRYASASGQPILFFRNVIAERDERGAFLVVLAIAVTAGRRLVEIGLISHRLQLGRHLAGVAGMDAVVAPRGGDQDRRIFLAGLCGVIGGIGLQPRPLLGLVGIAIFRDPARAREQLCVAAHVDQRDRAEQRAEALGIARQHVGDQDAAVRSAFARRSGPARVTPRRTRSAATAAKSSCASRLPA